MTSGESPIRFEVRATSSSARAGRLTTRRAVVDTPAFMPVATQSTVKAMTADEVAQSGARMVIMNTYHLWLRPGSELVERLGGLHQFSRWPHAIATDSGGFQAFSLSSLCRLSEDGFSFASHLDGSRHLLTPEESMRVQGALGSDVIMQLDVCPKAGCSRDELVSAVARTTRWAERCLQARDPRQALFGIIQGGTDVSLRRDHADALARLPLDGLALGGLSVGEPNEHMHATLRQVVPFVDPARIRYVMGVGTPTDLLRAIAVGVDLFDCVMPTRNARNGQAFVDDGRIVIKQARYRDDPRPLSEDCGCLACAGGYSRAYLRHLFMAKEMLSARLLSSHNLHFYGRLVAEARRAIEAGAYSEYAEHKLRGWGASLADGM